MATLLAMRSLVAARDPFADAKDTLSSWDKCMAKDYCKWPVIVAIIVGGIIVLSTVLCIARCLCCGAEVACCCFKCCTCCCPSGGRKGHQRVKTPPPRPYDASAYSSAPPVDTRPPHQQYRSHAVPTFNPAPAPTFNPAPAAPAFAPVSKPEPPQYARFDTHAKPVNEDALPAMPVWRDAKSVKVEEEVIPEKRDDVEMDRLDHNGSVAGTSMAAVAGGAMARRSPGPGRSPVQPIQNQEGYGYAQGYQNDPYANDSTNPGGYRGGYGQQLGDYRSVSPPQQSLSPVYGAGAGYAQSQQFDRRSPGPGYNQPARRSPGPAYDRYDQYDQPQQYPQPNPSRTPLPLNTNNYGYSNSPQYPDPMDVSPVEPSNAMYNNGYAPASTSAPMRHASPVHPPAAAPPMRDPSPIYAPSGSTRFDPPVPSASPAPAYPGQQTYETSGASYPGQQAYQAYTPGQTQGQQYSGISRKAVEGSWKEV